MTWMDTKLVPCRDTLQVRSFGTVEILQSKLCTDGVTERDSPPVPLPGEATRAEGAEATALVCTIEGAGDRRELIGG